MVLVVELLDEQLVRDLVVTQPVLIEPMEYGEHQVGAEDTCELIVILEK